MTGKNDRAERLGGIIWKNHWKNDRKERPERMLGRMTGKWQENA